MSAVMAGMRRATLIRLAFAAGGLWLLAGALIGVQHRDPSPDARSGAPVLPGLARQFDTLSEVRVTLPDGAYTLARGQDGVWGMVESGGYPVRPSAMAALLDGLASLTFETARTSDPEKYDRLGLGTPETGGVGARLVLTDGRGGVLADLIAGRRGDRTYVRMAGRDEAQTWRVNGDLPPLYSRAQWLDLAFIQVATDEIAAVSVRLSDGTGYALTAVDTEAFTPAPAEAGAQLTSRFAPLGPGQVLSRLVPVDVRRTADTASMSALATHETLLTDGTRITLTAWQAADGSGWVSVAASGDTARAQSVQARADGWLYRLGPQDFGDLTTPRSAIFRR